MIVSVRLPSQRQVRILTEAVDDITTIDDFLAVSGEWYLITRVDVLRPD